LSSVASSWLALWWASLFVRCVAGRGSGVVHPTAAQRRTQAGRAASTLRLTTTTAVTSATVLTTATAVTTPMCPAVEVTRCDSCVSAVQVLELWSGVVATYLKRIWTCVASRRTRMMLSCTLWQMAVRATTRTTAGLTCRPALRQLVHQRLLTRQRAMVGAALKTHSAAPLRCLFFPTSAAVILPATLRVLVCCSAPVRCDRMNYLL
jgi:hypothetical protein